MRCGVSQSVARVGNTSPDHCRHGIGYPLARSVLYEAPYHPCRCVPIRCNICQSYSYSYSGMRTFATFPDIIV